MSQMPRISITLTHGELLEVAGAQPPVAPTYARSCQCCGSNTELRHFVLLADLRLWTSCAACAAHNPDVKKLLNDAQEVTS